jgi:hypothetical protein
VRRDIVRRFMRSRTNGLMSRTNGLRFSIQIRRTPAP